MGCEKFLKHFLSPFSRQRCFTKCLVTAKIAGLPLECDLGAPAVGSFIFVDAADTAGVIFRDRLFFNRVADCFKAGAVHQGPRLVGLVPAAATGGVAVLEVGLADNSLISAGAAAFPPVLAGTLAVVGNDGEISELLTDPVLERRAAQAPAAPAVAGIQLSSRHDNCIAAVADTVPERAAEAIPALRAGLDDEFTETMSGQVF